MHTRSLALIVLVPFALVSSIAQAAPTRVPTGLALTASPQVVDVGSAAMFTLRARQWNGPVSVTLSFLSPHHGFTGTMPWRPACGCYQLAVILARRIHSLEQGRAVVRVRSGRSTVSTASMFQIRGLTNNGHDFAPGGRVVLQAWVSDPHPSKNQYQHYCAYTRTLDGLGVAGNHVSFVAHFPSGARTYAAGPTDRNGLACTSKSIGNLASGTSVRIQVYAGALRANLHFSSRT